MRSIARGAALGVLASIATGCSAARAFIHGPCLVTPEPVGDRGTIVESDHAIGDGFDNAAQSRPYDVIAHAGRHARTPVMIRAGYVEHGCHDDGMWRLAAPQLLAFATTRGRV